MLVKFDNTMEMQDFVDEISNEEANFAVDWNEMHVEVDREDIEHLADTVPLGDWIHTQFNGEVEDYDG